MQKSPKSISCIVVRISTLASFLARTRWSGADHVEMFGAKSQSPSFGGRQEIELVRRHGDSAWRVSLRARCWLTTCAGGRRHRRHASQT